MLPLLQAPSHHQSQLSSPYFSFSPQLRMGHPRHEQSHYDESGGWNQRRNPTSSTAASDTPNVNNFHRAQASTDAVLHLPGSREHLRAFPIRTSQPARNARFGPLQNKQQSRFQEHQLRRKTPSGTIDAGYDGSPAQSANSGLPPLKQLALSVTAENLPSVNATINGRLNYRIAADMSVGTWHQPSGPLQAQQAQQAPPVPPVPNAPGAYAFRSNWIHQNAHRQQQQNDGQAQGAFQSRQILPQHGAVPSPVSPYHEQIAYAGGMGLSQAQAQGYLMPQRIMPPSYGMVPGWNTCDFVATQPTVESRMQGDVLTGLTNNNNNNNNSNNTSQRSSLIGVGAAQLQSYSHGQLPSVDGGFVPLNCRLSGLQSALIPQHHQPQPQPQSQLQLQSPLQLDSHSCLGHQLISNVHTVHEGGGDTPSRPHFREKVLEQASKVYVELVAYVQSTRTARPSQTAAAGQRPTPRLSIFPTPPKTHYSRPRLGISHTDPIIHHASRTGGPGDSLRKGSGSLSYQLVPGYHADPHTGLLPAFQNGFGAVLRPDGRGPMYNNLSLTAPLSASRAPVYPGYERDANTPVANAQASIDIINTLCEQSNWKWIDGMLLGGCLRYGLEKYEDALEWFSRIVKLEPKHAEAISNTAACCYRLGRLQEAEKHWMAAIKARPCYLEATENLVGFLGASHRGREVVAVVDHLQNSLRLASRDREGLPAPQGQDSTSQPGFGSSGYAVPGDENGRILGLIHAKGNMLYALKDIEAASLAFEEAILIGAGRELASIRHLTEKIQSVLSPMHPSVPLLLLPDKAKHTASLVFAGYGGLPGLRYVTDAVAKRTSTTTTSNALLSLAKILQDAMSSGTVLANYSRQPAQVSDILALYYLSLSLMESPSTANNVGILLASLQQPTSPAPQQTEASVIPGIVPGSGLALALAYYQYGLQLDSKHVHLYTNLGSLLKDIGQLDLAIKMYQRAVECDGTFDIALTNLANAVKDRGRIADAIKYYQRAVESNPTFPEAVCGLMTALNSVCDWRGRGGVMLQDGKYDRWHVDSNGMLQDCRLQGSGGGLMKRVTDIVRRQLDEASTWGQGVLRGGALHELVRELYMSRACNNDSIDDITVKLMDWAGKPWEGSRVLRLVERATKVISRRWYLDKYVLGVENPKESYLRVQLPSSLSVPSAPTVLPFHTFTCPLPAKEIRMISQRNALRISCSTLRSTWLPRTVYPPPSPPNPHLNICYLSSDFNNHPLAHLMQSVFGLHNPSRAKSFCYATTAGDGSVHRQQIEREAFVFRDVSTWSTDRVINQIVADNIHILVNLNGYTRGARNEIFAARPAPILMSFMGFAGTLGAEWCDYLLADETAVPRSTLRPWRGNVTVSDVFVDERDTESSDWIYSENIVYCRDTFFCCDHAQSCESGERVVSWEMEQQRRWEMRKRLFPTLPDTAVILGNFNQLYKIDPTTFRTWLRVLAAVPNAYLWVLRFPEVGESNLRRTARDWAGEEVANRIIFTDVAPKQFHITRARVCDLFLDTPECNAHTTAADVLWSSTPLLTLPRYPYKMCSRMAASILRGALPKGVVGEASAKSLVAKDEEQYEKLAIQLASSMNYTKALQGHYTGSGRLWDLRKVLFENRWKCGLFNTRRWVSDLEDAYTEAWRRWVAGEEGDIEL